MTIISQIEQALNKNDLQVAYDLCSNALRKNSQPALLKIMSEIFLRSGEYFAAGNALLKYIDDFGFEPDVAIDCASAFQISSQNQITAIRLCRRSLAYKENLSQSNLNKLATMLMQHDLLDEAFEVLSFICEVYPLNIDSMHSLATCHKFFGDFKNCEHWIRKILEHNPSHYQSYSNLASLPERRFTEEDKITVLKMLSNIPKGSDTQPLHNALYQYYENQNKYLEAFHHLQKANFEEKLQLGEIRTDLKGSYKNAIRLFDILPPNQSFQSSTTRSPIFVVGLPRTGTTLTARLLSGHPDVIDAGERPFLTQCLAPMLKKTGAMPLSLQLSSSPLKSMIDGYVDIVRELAGSSKHFVDQKPTNYALIGFIKLLMPNATVIEVVRDPMDTCFSNYRQFFNRAVSGLHYTCDLNEIITHFKNYKNLMDFWHDKFPDGIYKLNYEDLVKNTIKETELLYKYCGLDFKTKYVKIENLKSSVSTASATQLREPVHSKYINRWKKYNSFLADTHKRVSEIFREETL
jgi:hypothetical protein|tara:strand:+ start:4314 stop:5873 length:1560 start_codon:yes stop_codon:yes gene_type:complete